MLTLPQLLQIPNVDNGLPYSVSPDEKQIIFSWNKSGTWELWSLNGKEISKLETGLDRAKFSPRFSPDGSMLAYTLDIDGSESYHIVVHDLRTNTSIDLTPQIAYAHQPNVSWSPDGKMLAVLSDMKGQFALFLLPIDGSPPHMVRNVFHPCWDVAWSPDGQWIALESESTASDRSLHLVPINRPRKGTKAQTIQLKINGKLLNAQHPAWSPDSKFLAFSAELDEWHDIGLFNAETQEITWVNQSIGDDTQPVWSRSGDIIGWIHSEGARTSFQFKKGSAAVEQVKVGDGVHAYPQITSEGVVILYEDVNRPPDLWRINLENGSTIQLTKSLGEEAGFLQPEEIWVGDVPALLYRTEGTKAVLYIHGGPNWNLQFSWNPELSYMASQGWTVLVPNYRGSTGYGKKWQNASQYDMGGVDAEDCAACAKYLLENGFEKVAVTGRSHGGFLTMSCLTTYPELFAGGSAVVPFLNWFKSHRNSREDLQHWNIENMGDPEDNKELWHARSPYFFLDKVSAPVQLICGENDPRCPASDSIDAHDKLLELGKEVELLLYKGEGHSFLQMENVIDAEMQRLKFLARVLKD
jgi:dipeptidyl aminopeptidase/acylaminoacyl peptidase